MLHDSVTFDCPEHSIPPYAAIILWVLVLYLIPPPHSLEHSDTSQSPHSQSTTVVKRKLISVENVVVYTKKSFHSNHIPGHSCILQLSVASEGPEQFSPPKAAMISGDRVLVCIPPPHVFEHSPTFQLPHSQSTLCLKEWNP